MTGASAGLHEEVRKLKLATIEQHRAIVSLMEELEAVDWYDQRVDATEDAELRPLLQISVSLAWTDPMLSRLGHSAMPGSRKPSQRKGSR